MLKFVSLKQETPIKRNTDNRKDDFAEIYDEFINQKAGEQSSRCSQCGIPFCQIHCPLSNNIPDWLKLTAEGRLMKLMKFLRARIICQRFVEEFVLKIGCVKETVLFKNLDMEQLQLDQ